MMGEADIDIKILMSTLSEELLKTTVQKLLYNIPGASRMAWDASNTISWSADPNQFDQHPTSYPASTVGAGNVANSLVFYQEPLIRDPLWNRMQALRLQLHSIPDKPEMIWLQIQSGVVTHAANFAEVFIPTANCDITNSPSCIVDTRTDSDLANWQTVVGQLFTDPNDFSAIRIPQTSVDTWNAPLRFGTYRKEKGFSMYIHDIVRSYRRLLLRKKIPGTIQDYGRLQLQTRTRGSYIPPSELRRAKDDIARGVQDGGLPTISSEITFQMTAEYALMAAYRPLSLATVLHEIPLHPLIQGFDGLTNEDILLLQVTIADTMRKNLHLGEKATYEEIEHCYLQHLGKPGIDEHKDISWLQLLDGLTAWTHAMDEYRRRKDLTVPMGSVLERFQWYFTMRSAIAVFKPLVPAMNNYLAQDQAMAS